MISKEAFAKMALSFPGTEQNPHFDRVAFKVTKKRIFCSYDEKTHSANVKLPLADQATFCEFDPNTVYPVPNKFGLQGWTTFELEQLPPELVNEALHTAYKDVV